MNFATYLPTVLKREKPFPREKRLQHAQIGMLSELGELADFVKRAFVYGKEYDPVNLLEEIGDYLWYFTLWTDVKQLHVGKLDGILASVSASQAAREAAELDPVMAVNALFVMTAALVSMELDDKFTAEHAEALGHVVGICSVLLAKYGFTMEQCFVVNDAKLEMRNKGGVFNAHAILNRDVEAERALLEAGAKQ